MPVAVGFSRAQLGVDAPLVTVEVQLGGGLPRFLIVGGGQVGERVASRVEKTGADVRLLEADRERSEELAATLDKTTVLHGDAELRMLEGGDLEARHLGKRQILGEEHRDDPGGPAVG